MNDQERHAGGCLCGAVRFTVDGPMREVVNCHCNQCTRFHGTFGAYSNAARSAVAFVEQRGLKWFQSSSFAHRGFCQECGSSLFWEQLGGDEISIAAGAIDLPTHLKTTKHIFVRHKSDFYEITDVLPRSED